MVMASLPPFAGLNRNDSVGVWHSRYPPSFTQLRLFLQVLVRPGALWERIKEDMDCVLDGEKADLHGCGGGVAGRRWDRALKALLRYSIH